MSYTVRINCPTNVDAQFADAKQYIIAKLTNAHLDDDANKLQLQLATTFHKVQDKRYTTSSYFKTKATEVTISDDLDKVLAELFQNINERLDRFQKEGSGWVFDSIDCLYIHINMYNPLTAGRWIEVPERWKHKKGIVNPKNSGDNFFMEMLCCALSGEKYKSKLTNQYKKYYDKYFPDFERHFKLPMQIKDIPKFSRQYKDHVKAITGKTLAVCV